MLIMVPIVPLKWPDLVRIEIAFDTKSLPMRPCFGKFVSCLANMSAFDVGDIILSAKFKI